LYYDNCKTYYTQKKLVYKWKLQSKTFNSLDTFFRNFSGFVFIGFSRTFLFLSSKTYRKRVLNNPKLLGQRILNVWNK